MSDIEALQAQLAISHVRRNGEWKIAASKLTRLHIDMHPAPAARS